MRRYGRDWPERFLDFWLTDWYYEAPLALKIPWTASALVGLVLVGSAWFAARLFIPRRYL